MTSVSNPEDIDVVVLCGGLGTRLRAAVNGKPKVMADINRRPFLDVLIDYIAGFKFKRFILCVGYMGHVIRGYYENRRGKIRDLTLLFSEEKELLGTAGAIKNAEALIRSNPFLVVNGDSFCRMDPGNFLDFHIKKRALFSIALGLPEKEADYGNVVLDSDRHIVSFNEKTKSNAGNFVNAGIYLFSRNVLELIPPKISYSLEYDLFPKNIDKGLFGFITGEKVIDIGTPERYGKAEELLKDVISSKKNG